MRITCLYLFGILLISVSNYTFSQESNRNTFSFEGSIIDESNGESIPFVNIFNETTRRWTIANESGEYSLSVCTGDTLVFSAIGFLGEVFYVKEFTGDHKATIKLTSQKYDIEEVKVFGYRNYEDFKKAFVELELPDNDIEIIKEKLNIEGTKIALEADYERHTKEVLNRGVGFSFPVHGMVISDKPLLEKLEHEDMMQRAIDKKYNREIVFELTKLPEDELTQFMGFCDFSKEYLYNANEYDILVSIEKKFELYQKVIAIDIDTCS